MVYFDSDYMVGAHPLVMQRLVDTNMLHTPGYGRDRFTAEARQTILDLCGIADYGDVFFLEGGTQANAVVIDRLLDHNDGVVAADTAHINVHEAGAIESNGHKILTLQGENGKISAPLLRRYIEDFYKDDTNRYMVRPAWCISHFLRNLARYTPEVNLRRSTAYVRTTIFHSILMARGSHTVSRLKTVM